jgi:hypothetical protein
MKKPMLLVALAANALFAAAVLYLVMPEVWAAFGAACLSFAIALAALILSARKRSADGRTVGVGTVCTVERDESAAAAGQRQVFIEVVAVSGESFIGKLAPSEGDVDMSMLRPGLVVLVAFDPDAREELSLPDDVLAVHASWLAAV